MLKKLKKKATWKTKSAYYTTSSILYGDCPYCKKMVIWSEKKTVNALRKWGRAKLKKK